MLKFGKSVHKLAVSLGAARVLTSARNVTVQKREAAKKSNVHSFVDDILFSKPVVGTAPTISRSIFHTENVQSFRESIQSQTIKTENDVLGILGHLVTLSNREPEEVAAWVKESQFPSVVASHALKDGAQPATVISILGSLFVLGYNPATRTADSSVSILHSFETLIPELKKRLMDILNGSKTELPMSSVISFLATLSSLNVSIDEDLKTLLQKTIELNVGELSSPSDVIAILRHMDLSQGILLERVLAKANELVPVMSNGHMVSVMKFLADKRKRDMTLLSQLANQLSKTYSPFTMNQVETLAYSANVLKFLDAALLRRISQEIQGNAASISNWNDMRMLMGSLIRLGIGDLATWDSLTKWMADNLDNAPKSFLMQCLLTCGMANFTSKSLRQIAQSVGERFSAPTLHESPIHWLNTAHALTLIGVLKQNVAEKLLRKEFISEITGAAKGENGAGLLLLHKLKIAQINAETKYGLRKYSGSRLRKEDIFGNSIELVENVSKVKQQKPIRSEFRHSLTFLASANHLSKPMLTEDSIFVDAFAEVSAEGRFVSVKDWNEWLSKKNVRRSHQRLAFVFIPFNRTLRNTVSGKERELKPSGDCAIDIRHLAAQGFEVVVFYEQEFPAGMEEVDRVNLVRERVRLSLARD